MTYKAADRVKQKTTTTGLGSYFFSASLSSYVDFADPVNGIGPNNSCGYGVLNGLDFELNLGTVAADGLSITRGGFLGSSTGSPINWGVGDKDIACMLPAKLAVFLSAALAGAPDANKIVKVSATGLYFDLVSQGTGGGIDADMLDGSHASAFALLSGMNMTGPDNWKKGADLASASTVNIGAATGNVIDLTGNTTWTAGDTVQAGAIRIIRVTTNPAPQFTHSGNFQMPGQVNFQARQYDQIIMMSYGGGVWVCIGVMRYDGTPVILPGATTTTKGAVEQATTAEVTSEAANVFPDAAALKYHKGIVKMSVVWNGTGTPAIIESNNVTSITDNGVGDYTLNITSAMPNANYNPSCGTHGYAVSNVNVNCGVHGTIGGGPTTKTSTALRVNVAAAPTAYDMPQNYTSILAAA